MSARPNFTGVDHTDKGIVLTGQSDPDPAGDVLAVHVVLTQGEQIGRATVTPPIGPGWRAVVTADDFDAGAATAIGVEVRQENATTVTWAQTVEIPAPPS